MNVDRMCYPKSRWWERLAARIVARLLLRCTSFQCSGKVNWRCNANVVDIQVPATQMAHWVLRTAGYSVCERDIIERRAP